MKRLILDLCGGTGAWSRPYQEAGYEVRLFDLPNDIRDLKWDPIEVHGILAAPPCTCFSYARNRYPATREQLRDALSIVDACLRAVMIYRPKWWALENPRAGLRKYLGPASLTFYQYEFGDDAAKPTCIWGQFVEPKRNPGPRRRVSTFKTNVPNAHPSHAITPPGFARAFFEANP